MSSYRKIILFAITGLIAVWLGFLCFNDEQLVKFYIKGIYYFISISIVLWLLAFFKEYNDLNRFKAIVKKHGLPLIAAFAVMSIGFLICKPEYRILADETNLVSDSQFLYDFKEPMIGISLCDFGNGAKDILRTKLDKRPALFPFMLYVCHVFLGYNAENAFILNYLCGSLALFLLYYLIQYRFGRYWGLCAMLFMAAFPLFLLYSASAGFEVFNLLCALIFFLFVYKFLKNPNAQWAEILLLWLPLLGQSRYESVSAVFIALPLVWYALPKSEYSKLSYKFVIMPFLFLPVAWLRVLTSGSDSWQVKNIEEAFSVNNFFYNFRNALEFFFIPNDAYGTIPILAILALLFLICCIFKKKETNSPIKLPLIFVVLSFYIFHSAARFCYILDDLRIIWASRLGIIFLPLIVYGAVAFLTLVFERFKLKKILCSIAVAGLFFFYWPNAAANCGVGDEPLFWELKLTREFLKNYLPNQREYVVLCVRSNFYVPLGYSSVEFIQFFKNRERILDFYSKGLFKYFVVIQNIDITNNLPADGHDLEGFNLQPLYEVQFNKDYIYRISKGYPKSAPRKEINSVNEKPLPNNF